MFDASLMLDAYKTFHVHAYKEGVTHVYSNFTNRHGKYSNIEGNKEVMFVGLQYFIKEVLIDRWNKTFFEKPMSEAVGEYARVVGSMLGKQIKVEHMEALHKLGYMPIEIKALPEGTMVPYGVPSLVIVNTVEGFGWVTNMLETVMSAELWGIGTSATTSFAYRKNFVGSKYNEALLPFMVHDFSYRGMFGTQAAAMSGFGHLCSFAGSDTIPAALFAEKYYGAKIDQELVFASVDATEHSVATSYGPDGEYEYLDHLMTNVTPTGVISLVADSYDFWSLVTDHLPKIKDKIMSRDGTVTIRPDSGCPVKIVCGDPDAKTEHERKGLVEVLWDIFGGTITDDGYKQLDPHIGVIYGDSITLDRHKQFIEKLNAKGFVMSVLVGAGSMSFQLVTRDTHGSAVKATDIQFGTGNHVEIFKDPKTDSKKKSAKGLLRVDKVDGKLVLTDQVSPEDEGGLLETVFKDGVLIKETSLNEIRDRVNSYFN